MELISEAGVKKWIETKGHFLQCAPPRAAALAQHKHLFAISSSPIHYLPMFLGDRQIFLPRSPVSQWLLRWAFSFFVLYVFLWKSRKCWTVANWYSWVFGHHDYAGENEQRVSVAKFPWQQRLKTGKRHLLLVVELCWRWGIPCSPFLPQTVEAQYKAQQLCTRRDTLQRSAAQSKSQLKITAPLQRILAWDSEAALLTGHGSRAVSVSPGSRRWGWLTGPERWLQMSPRKQFRWSRPPRWLTRAAQLRTTLNCCWVRSPGAEQKSNKRK